MTDAFPATRAHGLEIMRAFIPRMGRRYADGRNYDHGPGQHHAVSMLSPYIRRGLVTEEELVRVALAAHGADAAEKLIEEVIWRGYFKGWLERRPSVWTSYVTGLSDDLAALERDRRLARRVEQAETGRTGIECFDAWARELVDTGYLHNHARMWFASIWIFTLDLPWRVGADFFYRHLLDGDAASNTLGWRWVAGLHTRGKPYAADAQNIATYTARRFQPRSTDLAEVVEGLEVQEPDGLPPVQPLRSIEQPEPATPSLLLVSDEDCMIDPQNIAALDIGATVSLTTSHLRSPRPVCDHVARFEAGALDDTVTRLGLTATRMDAGHPEDLVRVALKQNLHQIVTPYVTRGPFQDWLEKARPLLVANGIRFSEWRRPWDEMIWPHATAGFFKVKKQIPHILRTLDRS
ncbi:deoxyribodipyrimidine photolyase (plasmid) [Peteryoungia desertarenae]|uniref:Deoxyribodipyrimidine photolyase n=1 Tax=Peteryoungia desertarenae TaxID=1813451 RepID=A0ABX6QTS9_9HYPH|nr:FAD-binding domain-containing protein [Peteryoungia desertarenae]QLF71894.1 deoxyribodipyrimidine photolyase [Peteryoungia desertarenae]